jgi:hypothetical protein
MLILTRVFSAPPCCIKCLKGSNHKTKKVEQYVGVIIDFWLLSFYSYQRVAMSLKVVSAAFLQNSAQSAKNLYLQKKMFCIESGKETNKNNVVKNIFS